MPPDGIAQDLIAVSVRTCWGEERAQDWTSAIGSKRYGNILGLGILRQQDTSCCFGFYGHLSVPTIIRLSTTAYTEDRVAASQLIARA